jgi:hypothetical protein
MATGQGNGLEGISIPPNERTSGVEYPARGHSLPLHGDFTVPPLSTFYNFHLVGVFGGIPKVPDKILGVSYLDFNLTFGNVFP